MTVNIFPAKIYSRVNINSLTFKFATQKYSTKKSCLFNYNLSLSHTAETKQYTMKYCFYIGYAVFLLNVLNKNENIINAGYWVLFENRKN